MVKYRQNKTIILNNVLSPDSGVVFNLPTFLYLYRRILPFVSEGVGEYPLCHISDTLQLCFEIVMIYKQQEHLPFTAWLSTNRQEGFY